MKELLAGPLIPLYPGPFDVPVLVDSRKHHGAFQMTRFTYFVAAATDASVDDWISALRLREIPFLLLGTTAVLHRPDFETASFHSPDQIDVLFDSIEKVTDVVVETAHVWLPNDLVDPLETIRGEVVRLGYGLFRSALQYQRGGISTSRFLQFCELARRSDVRIAPEETHAFRLWSAQQIAAARDNFERQKLNPYREALDWYDAEGVRHPA